MMALSNVDLTAVRPGPLSWAEQTVVVDLLELQAKHTQLLAAPAARSLPADPDGVRTVCEHLARIQREVLLDPPPGPPVPGSISGRVVTALPGRPGVVPFEGARIEVLGTSLVGLSDSGGNFRIEGITTDVGQVLFRADLDDNGVADRQKLISPAGAEGRAEQAGLARRRGALGERGGARPGAARRRLERQRPCRHARLRAHRSVHHDHFQRWLVHSRSICQK
ncbi:MAG: hypothetical protein QM736_29830, partial [Vicinamibacterales bacterium]